MTTHNLMANKLDAEYREAAAKLHVLEAEAEARKAKTDMQEIAGLRTAGDRVQRKLTDMKRQVSANLDAARREVETELHELEAGIKRVGERFAEWDAARERGFHARLDEAEARLKVWNARADQWKVEVGIKGHDELAKLQERIALAKARLAEWRRARHDRKAQEALEMAARHFDEAFDAASKRYQK